MTNAKTFRWIPTWERGANHIFSEVITNSNSINDEKSK